MIGNETGSKVHLWAWVIGALFVSLLLIGGLAIFYFGFTESPSDLTELGGYYGTLGDLVGGILNPVIGVLSVVFLAYTLLQNSEALRLTHLELEETRKELARQADFVSQANAMTKTRDDYEKWRVEFRHIADLLGEVLNEKRFTSDEAGLDRISLSQRLMHGPGDEIFYQIPTDAFDDLLEYVKGLASLLLTSRHLILDHDFARTSDLYEISRHVKCAMEIRCVDFPIPFDKVDGDDIGICSSSVGNFRLAHHETKAYEIYENVAAFGEYYRELMGEFGRLQHKIMASTKTGTPSQQ